MLCPELILLLPMPPEYQNYRYVPSNLILQDIYILNDIMFLYKLTYIFTFDDHYLPKREEFAQ